MFQNITEEAINNSSDINSKYGQAKFNIFANIFTKKYLIIYIITFMISLIGINSDVSLFSISMLGACIANSVPIVGVIIVSIIGSFIKFGAGGALAYILTVLVVFATFFMIKPVYNEQERNEKIKIGKNLLFATFVVQIAKIGISGFTIYDILLSVSFSIIVFVFYKIFVNSITVLQDFGDKKAFSIEEVIGTSLLLAIAFGAFGDLAIFGLSIRNILSILIVLILGWKNGILVGTTAGVTIGITLGVITSSEPIMIAAYAISGMIAGILNKFGKIGVIVGFALGNVVLAYVSNGYTVELIHFKEILVASIRITCSS